MHTAPKNGFEERGPAMEFWHRELAGRVSAGRFSPAGPGDAPPGGRRVGSFVETWRNAGGFKALTAAHCRVALEEIEPTDPAPSHRHRLSQDPLAKPRLERPAQDQIDGHGEMVADEDHGGPVGRGRGAD